MSVDASFACPVILKRYELGMGVVSHGDRVDMGSVKHVDFNLHLVVDLLLSAGH